MDITIRAAKPEDIPQMGDLLTDLFTIELDFSPDIERQTRGLSMLITDTSGSSLVLVAVNEENLVGMATVQTLVSTAEGGQVGLVEDVIEDSRFRCRNIGTLLLDGLVSWSRKKKLTRLQLLADRENHQALNFYSSRGWDTTRLVCLRNKLLSLIPSSRVFSERDRTCLKSVQLPLFFVEVSAFRPVRH
ncbi:MAG TPA: GNAT family N-acetyltransferase [Nitrospirota bacterium]